jgi:glycosyltransferase involved in cell wall biosynthesis
MLPAAPDRDLVHTLFISDERAWPPISGYRQRTGQILSTLARLGPVTWIAGPRNRFDDGSGLDVPADVRPQIEAVLVPAATRRPAAAARRWLTTDLPWPLAAGDWSDVDRVLRQRTADRFDLIWAMGLDALGAVERGRLEARATVVDADLESLKLARQLQHDPPSRLRTVIGRVDVGRWCRLEQAAAQRLSGFSVCSEEERVRVGGSAFVTPNSYPALDADPVRARTPSLLFVGSMGYEPNRAGVAWFAREVLPSIRRDHPEVAFRIVGSGPPLDPSIAELDGVEGIGPVDNIGRELGRAAAAVVPIGWGAGTRIKILEAIAHRVPVVSTTIGAEGLGLSDERHLLLADDADGFADACHRALGARADIVAMTERAHEAFASQYERTAVSHRLELQVRQLLSGRRSDDGPPTPAHRPS